VTFELKGGGWKSGKGLKMKKDNVIRFAQFREKEKQVRKTVSLNVGKKGRVYNRGGRLWIDFHYLGQRVRESSGLEYTHQNQLLVRKKLDLILAEIENEVFEFAKRFPHSRQKDKFTELEGRLATKDPQDVIFGDYVQKWRMAMEPGMSESQIRDYSSILNHHLLPYFGQRPFSEINPVLLKKFIAALKGKKLTSGKNLSAKRIHNVMIPLRVIVKDAIVEYGWKDFPNPFAGVKLPKPSKTRVFPFSYREWKQLREFIPAWYRPYFEFSVQTGLRPSEQVALKWKAIGREHIHVELSRVRNKEKAELKTEDSRRSIAIRPTMAKVLKDQKKLTANFHSSYVFINTQGRPILQEKLRELWVSAMKKSGLKYRRMYETRHTFASWALAAGESPEWIARTLGHVDTWMVYKTYGRYIPNLKWQDGSAFEKQFSEKIN
jgi:integrase